MGTTGLSKSEYTSLKNQDNNKEDLRSIVSYLEKIEYIGGEKYVHITPHRKPVDFMLELWWDKNRKIYIVNLAYPSINFNLNLNDTENIIKFLKENIDIGEDFSLTFESQITMNVKEYCSIKNKFFYYNNDNAITIHDYKYKLVTFANKKLIDFILSEFCIDSEIKKGEC